MRFYLHCPARVLIETPILFLEQNSKISRVLYVLKLLQIKMHGLLLACSLVLGLNIHLSHSKLILELVYLDSKQV